jgi:hypothetical protein
MATPVYPPGPQPDQEPPAPMQYQVFTDDAGAVHAVPNPQWTPDGQGAAEVPPTFQAQPPVPLPVYEQPVVPQLADQANATPQPIPEGGYAQRFVDIPLPELNLPGIQCSVRMRNPGMMSQGAFEEITEAVKAVQVGEDGQPSEDDAAAQLPLMQAQMLKLIAAWTVWDAESAEDVPPLLPSPPRTVDDLKRAPLQVLKAVMGAFQELRDPQ